MSKHYCVFDSMFQLSILHKGLEQKIVQIYGGWSVERTPGALIKPKRSAWWRVVFTRISLLQLPRWGDDASLNLVTNVYNPSLYSIT